MKIFLFAFVFFSMPFNSFCQVAFNTIYGNKANYSISIPQNYYSKEAIGANVDLKFINSEGASIITVVRNLPFKISEKDIASLNLSSDQEFIDQLESTGLQNIRLIKKGLIKINGVTSYFSYYRDSELYYHSITQFRKGKILNLTYTCEYFKREIYMPYIFRVVNSFKS